MKPKKKRTAPKALSRNPAGTIRKLNQELADLKQVLSAIQGGQVDALFVSDSHGDHIFTLKSADQPYRTLVESMNEGAATLRSDGLVLYCNSRFSELLQVPLESLIGASIFNFISEREFAPFHEVVDGSKGSSKNIIVTLKTAQKHKVTTKISMSRVKIEGEIGVCIVATDLSERILIEESLRKSRDLLETRVAERTSELAKAVKVRDDFLSIASHELKTPLTSLKLQAQLRQRKLSTGELSYFAPENIKRLVDDDERQINRLMLLVDDMLDLTRLTTGKLSLDLQEMDLCQVIREVINRLAPQLSVSSTKIIFKPLCPVLGKWDQYRMEQIFTNLLTNALKYGSNKPIEVKIVSDKLVVTLTIIDQGIGIAKHDHTRIFEQFERAISVNEVSGLGLGLFIVKQLVEAHGGNIWVESELKRGATFVMEIPHNPKASKHLAAARNSYVL